jgi:hypothetical protein
MPMNVHRPAVNLVPPPLLTPGESTQGEIVRVALMERPAQEVPTIKGPTQQGSVQEESGTVLIRGVPTQVEVAAIDASPGHRGHPLK